MIKNLSLPLLGLLLLSTASLMPFMAFAQEAEAPRAPSTEDAQDHHNSIISGEGVLELQTEQGVGSDDSDNEHNNTFWRTEIAPTIRINDNFYVAGNIVLEPVRDFDADEDNFFEEEGVYFEELNFNYENGPLHIVAGKFHPEFAKAWDWGRGIWGEDFNEDYEITEKMGVGADYSFDAMGKQKISVATFFADTTFLSESAITHRGNNSKSDGGVSNTENFSSYTADLSGEDVFGVSGLYYKLGLRHQAAGDADVGADDENGYAVTLGRTFPITQRLSEDALLEYASISNFDSGPDDNEYMTASFITKLDDKWNLTLGYTKRNIDVSAGNDVHDHLMQATVGYDFGNGLTLEGGWRGTQEDDVDNNIVGGLARYQFDF